MDTAEFRQQCLDAAVAAGTLTKAQDNLWRTKSGHEFSKEQFTQYLSQDEWLTSTVMMDVFGNYSAAVDALYEYTDAADVTTSQALKLAEKINKQSTTLGKSADEVIDEFYKGDEALKKLVAGVDEFGVKAFKAAQEARTFTDVIDSVKDAVSTGWMNSFELIFGDYETAKTLWTNLANELWDIFAGGAEGRNDILKEWVELGGRNMLFMYDEENGNFGALWDVLHSIEDVIATIKDAFTETFGEVTGETLTDLTVKLKDFTSTLAMDEETSKNLKDTFKGIFSILKIGKELITAIVAPFNQLYWSFRGIDKQGTGLVATILSITGSLGRMLINISTTVHQSQIFYKIVNVLWKGLNALYAAVKPLVDTLKGGGATVLKILEKFFRLQASLNVLNTILN